MSTIIRPLGTEISCNTTANSYSADVVRLWNSNTTTPYLVTRAFANGVAIGTVTIGPNMEMYIDKTPTDLLSSNNTASAIFAAPVSQH